MQLIQRNNSHQTYSVSKIENVVPLINILNCCGNNETLQTALHRNPLLPAVGFLVQLSTMLIFYFTLSQ